MHQTMCKTRLASVSTILLNKIHIVIVGGQQMTNSIKMEIVLETDNIAYHSCHLSDISTATYHVSKECTPSSKYCTYKRIFINCESNQ